MLGPRFCLAITVSSFGSVAFIHLHHKARVAMTQKAFLVATSGSFFAEVQI
jgi:hypothetical protein